jgi:hypothetical protein
MALSSTTNQDFDASHLPEIEQVQKAFPDTRLTIFAGTSKDLDTCLEAQYRLGSRGVWHIPCSCPKKFHSLGDPEIIPNMMVSPEGLRCPDNKHIRLNPMAGEFVHEDRSRLRVNMPSFHLPQVIVPEYAQGKRFMDIWQYYQRYTQNGQFKKFLQEIWGIAVESGMTELSEADLKKCCTDKTFKRTQSDYLEDKVRYIKVFSGVDWGGSDWEPAYRSKLSYTVHVIYGMTPEGRMDLIYAHRYAGMNYREIAQHIVAAHNKYQAFAMGTDNGGGAYYNAHMRDCGAIPTNLLIHFQYTDTKLMLDRIPHPESNIMSLHRSDSISAVLADIKDGMITWPRWDDSSSFALDCLNVRRNITEAPSGRTIMRYIKHGARADDFLMATNYACMMKRIVCRESLIPNKQIMDELRTMFGIAIPNDMAARMGDLFDGGYVGGWTAVRAVRFAPFPAPRLGDEHPALISTLSAFTSGRQPPLTTHQPSRDRTHQRTADGSGRLIWSGVRFRGMLDTGRSSNGSLHVFRSHFGQHPRWWTWPRFSAGTIWPLLSSCALPHSLQVTVSSPSRISRQGSLASCAFHVALDLSGFASAISAQIVS